MLFLVVFISLILIVCNAFYETDEPQEKTGINEQELRKINKK